MSKSKFDALKAVYQWVTRTMMKNQTGVMQTLPSRDLIELNTQITAQRLMQGGVDPTALKNANQVENAINIIESRPVQEGIKSTKAGKVFDMEGQEIPQGSRIIGGKAVKETEAEIAARMSKENKEAAERIRKQKESTTSLDDEIKQAYDKAVKEDKFKNVRLRDGRKIESEEDFREYIDELNEDSNFAEGGRARFKTGLGKRFLELFKPKPKPKFDERRFREGPIDLDFLQNVDKKDLEKFIRTRDTKGPGSYGMYDNFADMPAGLKAAELISRIKKKGGGIDYEAAEFFLGKKLRGDESIDELIQILNRQEMRAEGGRAGFNNGGAPSIVLNPEEREMGKVFETDKVEEAIKEIIKRSIGPLDMAEIPLTEKGRLRFGFDSSGDRQISGGLDLLGGELDFGAGSGRQGKGIGFEFRKKFGPGAKGKRVNRKEGGGMSRRQFMKIMGGIASLPFIGKFFKGAKPAAKVAEVATKSTAGQPPEYFFDLAAKIKILGKESISAPRERMIEVNYKNYSLQEDLVTGDMTIVKRKGDPEFGYEEEVMVLRKGQADETTKGKTPPDEYEEVTVKPDPEGKMKDVEDGIEPESIQEIMEEVGQGGGNLDQKTLEEIARGKLASGGVAMMLGE